MATSHATSTARQNGLAPDLFYPDYPELSSGPWRLQHVQMLAARGYWGDVHPVSGTVILTGPSEAEQQSWMSLLPSETESQEIGLRAAYGHTVVCGMGMGWLVANLALKAEVTRVTVLERDARVLDMIAGAAIFAQLPAAARDKIVIIQTDALQWRPDQPVDTLQADIWRKFAEPQKLADVQQMQANMAAAKVYFWGQEMEIWRYACRRSAGKPALDWPGIAQIIADDFKLPLIVPDWPDYPARISAAAEWWTPRESDWWQA